MTYITQMANMTEIMNEFFGSEVRSTKLESKVKYSGITHTIHEELNLAYIYQFPNKNTDLGQ